MFNFTINQVINILQGAGALFLSVIVGVMFFKKLSPFFKVLFYQSVMACGIYVLAYQASNFQETYSASLGQGITIEIIHCIVIVVLLWFAMRVLFGSESMRKSVLAFPIVLLFCILAIIGFKDDWTLLHSSINQWLYNLSTLAETIFLLWAFKKLEASSVMKVLTRSTLLFVLLAMVIQSYYTSVYTFANYAVVLEGIFMTVLFIWHLFRKSYFEKRTWKLNTEFVVLAGTVLYFVGYTPYMGVFEYLNSNYPVLSTSLYYSVILSLGTVRYLSLSWGVWNSSRLKRASNYL